MKKLISSVLAVCIVLSSAFVFASSASKDDGQPISFSESVSAPHEDSGIKLWFDHASEKVSDKVGAEGDTGMTSFTAYMAKNEIENIQFVLCSADGNARDDMSAELSEFKNENGDTLEAEILIELYQNCGKFGTVPDALPPLSAYGAFSLSGSGSQAFLIKLKSRSDTAAGVYESMLSIKDSAGNTVKCAPVRAVVWDFELSDETACATSIRLDYSYLQKYSYGNTDYMGLYKNYYDYLLENRICASNLPGRLNEESTWTEYMDNPRVRAFYGDKNYYDPFGGKTTPPQNSQMKRIGPAFSDSEKGLERFNKAYYFSNVVDSSLPEELEELRAYYDKASTVLTQYAPEDAQVPFWFISTFINDIDYTREDGIVIDQIDYYSDFVNLWCSKPFAYTGAWELEDTEGAKLLQDPKWDSVYGTFSERMASFKERGDKIWWFTSWDVEEPYINYFIQTDGVAQRILFWQQYDNGVEGYLTNFVNFWIVGDPYSNCLTDAANSPNGYGESILIYPGGKYGLDVPVSSLRLEAMRDGIEDYQMFYMLEELLGDGAADKYIDEMTAGMVHYSTSDEKYYSTREALGNAVEKIMTCSHSYENGVCIKCGALEVVSDTKNRGDLDQNGVFNSDDAVFLYDMLTESSKEREVYPSEYDMNGDGNVDMRDAQYLLLCALIPEQYSLNRSE